MKKLLILLLAFMTLFAIVACAEPSTSPAPNPDNPGTDPEQPETRRSEVQV